MKENKRRDLKKEDNGPASITQVGGAHERICWK